MVSALLERCKSAGVNVHAQSRDGANTLAHQAARRDDPGLLALLLRAGLDPNTPNGAGSVPALGDGNAGSRAAGQRVSGLMDWRSLLDRSTPLTLLATKDFGLTDKGAPPGPPPEWPVRFQPPVLFSLRDGPQPKTDRACGCVALGCTPAVQL